MAYLTFFMLVLATVAMLLLTLFFLALGTSYLRESADEQDLAPQDRLIQDEHIILCFVGAVLAGMVALGGVVQCGRAWPWGLELQREAAGAGVPLSAVEGGHPKGPVHRSLRPSPCFAVTANPACVACTGAAPVGLWEGGKTKPTAMATTRTPYTRCAYCKRETTATNRYQRYERRAWTLYPTTNKFSCPDCRRVAWADEQAARRQLIRQDLQREMFAQWLERNDREDAARGLLTNTVA